MIKKLNHEFAGYITRGTGSTEDALDALFF